MIVAKDSATASFAQTYDRALQTELKAADTDFLRAPDGDSAGECDDDEDQEDEEEEEARGRRRSKMLREKISTKEVERQLIEKSRNRVIFFHSR